MFFNEFLEFFASFCWKLDKIRDVLRKCIFFPKKSTSDIYELKKLPICTFELFETILRKIPFVKSSLFKNRQKWAENADYFIPAASSVFFHLSFASFSLKIWDALTKYFFDSHLYECSKINVSSICRHKRFEPIKLLKMNIASLTTNEN